MDPPHPPSVKRGGRGRAKDERPAAEGGTPGSCPRFPGSRSPAPGPGASLSSPPPPPLPCQPPPPPAQSRFRPLKLSTGLISLVAITVTRLIGPGAEPAPSSLAPHPCPGVARKCQGARSPWPRAPRPEWPGRRTLLPQRRQRQPRACDVRKTWRRFEITKPKPVESDDETTEDYPVAKNMLHRLSVDLTLDPATAHRCLLLSPDRRSVRLGDPGVPAPADGPRRFDQLLGVLAAQGFEGGRHCWEVETVAEPGEGEDEGGRYALGAAGESVRRKGRVGLCPASGVWAVERSGGRLWALTAPEATPLQGRPRRIRVDVDWERGRVAFYDGLSLDLLYAFQGPGPFGERVFPFFCTLDPHTPLRLVPTEG
uniref:Ring finger protein 39 n=1 Tax=Ornithorhynchus anatinus TaxID=9258 RepID=F7E3N9_ORNAN